MIQCPECRTMLPEDSAFCDKCGKELKWCPECKRPKRGTECPVCGNDLIPGRRYLAMMEGREPAPSSPGYQAPQQPSSGSQAAPQQPSSGYQAAPQQPSAGYQAAPQQPSPNYQAAPQQPSSNYQAAPPPQGTAVAGAPALPTALVGNGWRLQLTEGPFGRVGGIWPELGTCQYVSSNHGFVSRTAAGWTITDNGSTNGTFINDARMAAGQPSVLGKGTRVRIATLDFIVE